jgi:hypothetical protein
MAAGGSAKALEARDRARPRGAAFRPRGGPPRGRARCLGRRVSVVIVGIDPGLAGAGALMLANAEVLDTSCSTGTRTSSVRRTRARASCGWAAGDPR